MTNDGITGKEDGVMVYKLSWGRQEGFRMIALRRLPWEHVFEKDGEKMKRNQVFMKLRDDHLSNYPVSIKALGWRQAEYAYDLEGKAYGYGRSWPRKLRSQMRLEGLGHLAYSSPSANVDQTELNKVYCVHLSKEEQEQSSLPSFSFPSFLSPSLSPSSVLHHVLKATLKICKGIVHSN